MSYQVIARKYRPQRFDDLVGQRLVSETLKNAILSGRVAHGYIFSGARGVGKTTTARILARSLNCIQGPTVEPCGECASCQEIAAGNSVDVLEIDAASNRGIDEIRELRENVRYLPARDRTKIFIIDEVHMLTTEAFNALLKTLEEPPDRSLFILATTEAHKLPATIQSRCQHFAFRLLDYSEILARLKEICAREGVEAEADALGAIAQAGEGSLRDALSLLDEVIAACGQKVDAERARQLLGVVPAALFAALIEDIQAGNTASALERVSQLTAEGHDLAAFCGEMTRYTRNLMVARSCGADSPLLQVPDDERATLEKLSASLSEEDLTRFLQALLRAQSEMRYSLQPRFHLELALMKLAHAPKLVAIETLLSALKSQAAAMPARSSGQGPASAPQGGSSGQNNPGHRAPSGPSGGTPPWRRADSAAAAAAKRTIPAEPVHSFAAGLEAPSNEGGEASVAGAALPEHASLTAEDAALSKGVAAPEDARFAAIKAVLFEQSKFLSSCLNPVVGWRFEDGQAHFTYPKEGAWAADLLKTREHQEKLSSACERVLGQPVKIHVTLASEEAQAAVPRASAQQKAQRDPAVEALQKQFDCVLMDVKDLRRE
ncbi:MAG TPA: DNA polymerase III subunit gamma/tau [Terriglobia bacterium]|nr:DNA polymerase III subunit gamma/tau [Terriglobia bacterium]